MNDAPPAELSSIGADNERGSVDESYERLASDDDATLTAALTFADEIGAANAAALRAKLEAAPDQPWLDPARIDLDNWTTQKQFTVYKVGGHADNKLTRSKRKDVTAVGLCDLLKPYPVKRKDTAGGWFAREVISNEIKEGQKGNKGNDNVASISLLVFDVDNKSGRPLTARNIRRILKRAGLAALILETYSSTAEVPKFRVVTFLADSFGVGDDPARHELYKRAYAYLSRMFPGADPVTKDVGRFWYDPSYPEGGTPGICEFVSGNLLEANYVFAQAPEPERARARETSKRETSGGRSGRAQDRYKTPRLMEIAARDKNQTLRILDWMRDKCPERIVNDGGTDKEQIESPVSDQHNGGAGFNPASPGAFAQQGEGGWNLFDSHASGAAAFSRPIGKHDKWLMLDMLLQEAGVIDAVEELAPYCDELEPRRSGRDGAAGDGDGLEVDQHGTPYKSAENIRRLLELENVVIRYNEFTDTTIIEGLDGFGPELDDAAVTRLRIIAEDKHRLNVTKDKFYDVVMDTGRRNSLHPVREYLDRCQAQWDGVPRVDTFLPRYFGAEDTPLNHAFGRCQLIGTAMRARKPGVKHDEILILENPQGGFKSTALSILAINSEWFTDTYKLGSESQKSIEQTRGKLIVEVGEMSGMKGNEVEALKADLSRRTDRARMAYGRLAIDVPRGFTLWGTTNDDRYLKDITGNRRFWPVKCGGIDTEALRRGPGPSLG